MLCNLLTNHTCLNNYNDVQLIVIKIEIWDINGQKIWKALTKNLIFKDSSEYLKSICIIQRITLECPVKHKKRNLTIIYMGQ